MQLHIDGLDRWYRKIDASYRRISSLLIILEHRISRLDEHTDRWWIASQRVVPVNYQWRMYTNPSFTCAMHVGFINLELRLGSWSIWGRGWGISQTPAGCMYVCMDVCMRWFVYTFSGYLGWKFFTWCFGDVVVEGIRIFCYLSIRVEDGRTLTAWIYELDMEWVARMWCSRDGFHGCMLSRVIGWMDG